MSSEGEFTRPLDARIPEIPLWVPPQDMGGGRIQNFMSMAAQGLGLRDELVKVVSTNESDKGRREGALAVSGPTASHPFPIHITRLLTSTLLHVLVDLSAVSESGSGAGHPFHPFLKYIPRHFIYPFTPSHTPLISLPHHPPTHIHTHPFIPLRTPLPPSPLSYRSSHLPYPCRLPCFHSKTSLQSSVS